MACAICGVRRPRRFCPGVRGEICTICCGEEREVSVTCPLDCEYLQDARRHEKPVPIDAEQIPNRDIRVTEGFLREHDELLVFLGHTLALAALEGAGTVDFDVREALQALIRTYRTLESGVLYESVPNNPLAARLFRIVQDRLAEFRQAEQQRLGMSRTRDRDVLGVLVFLERVELDRNNGRRQGRAFVDAMRHVYGEVPGPAAPSGSSLILP